MANQPSVPTIASVAINSTEGLEAANLLSTPPLQRGGMDMNFRLICLIPVLTFLLCFLNSAESLAAARTGLWTKMCGSCHDGTTAISKDTLKEKYQTVSSFTDAVLNKGSRCMNILKNDKKMIRKIAAEIGLKKD